MCPLNTIEVVAAEVQRRRHRAGGHHQAEVAAVGRPPYNDGTLSISESKSGFDYSWGLSLESEQKTRQLPSSAPRCP